MTPELAAAVARAEAVADALMAKGEAGPIVSAQAIRLVLAAVRESPEAEKLIGPMQDFGHDWRAVVDTPKSGMHSYVHGRTREECLRRARAVAQVAAREVERG